MMAITKLIFTIFVFVLVCSTANDFLFVSGEPAGNGTHHQVIRCKDNEREALLTLKKGLTNRTSYSTHLSSWGSAKGDEECCDWDGVTCNNMTGHVIELTLHALRGEISPALLELSHLNYMDLSYSDFGGKKIPEFIGSLGTLEYLVLFDSNFSGDVPYQLGNLTNLRGLYLSGNHLTSKDLSWLSNLTLLSVLALSGNQFDGPLSWLSNLTLLSYLDLSNNQFDVPFPDLKALSSLTGLYLHHNKLTGELPKSIGLFSNLEVLYVSYNSLEGTISDVHFTKLHNLTLLDLSFNSLSLNFSSHWIPPFQLDHILLANCSMGPHFPSWLQTQNQVATLDLSLAGISDKFPSWFSSVPFSQLNLSHNSMSDLVPAHTFTRFNHIDHIITTDISFNNFSGPLPPFHSSSWILDFSHNMFSGTIQSICTTTRAAMSLDLSYNQLSGELPNCFENMTTLRVLNLAENRFHGHLPPTLGSLVSLQTLILRNNNFIGELPPALSTCRDLQLIDCGGNALTGHVPTWMGSLTNLVFIILAQNSFYGNIPPEICRLSHIQVLDLSHNNISGRIPQCFQNFTSLVQTNGSTGVANVSLREYDPDDRFVAYSENAIVQWKRQESEYRNILRLLKLIDFSSNNLVGNIPLEISCLAGLASLNLSQNHFTGNIFSEIGQMKMLESLDLSRNNLSGEIPASLAELNFLSLLDLASNNLSGKIPQGGQLHSFDAYAYAGNEELCGQPLPNCPGDNPPPMPSAANRGNQGAIEDQTEGFNLIQSLIEEYFISAILGFIVGFWIIIGPLVVKRTWRNAYFGFWSMIGDWFYLMVTLSWRRLIRYMKSRN